MIIGINATALSIEYKTGVERYTEYIIRYLIERGKDDHKFVLYTPKPLSDEFAPYTKVLKSRLPWTQFRLPIELLLHKPDVFFQPSYMLPPICPCPSVTVIHDLAWCHFSSSYSDDQLKKQKLTIKRLFTHKSFVITPSDDAKKDLEHFFEFNPHNIQVVPEALIELPPADIKKYPKIEQYAERAIVLSVSRLENRKNTVNLVKAFQTMSLDFVKPNQSKPLLVLVGKPGLGADEVFAAVNRAKNVGAEVLVLSDVDDEQLSAWMSIAKILAYPSLYEGFGLPILQAFAADLPVLTTEVSSIPEVGGDAVMYVKNPKDDDELAVAMHTLLYNEAKQQILTERGRKQLKKFSWVKAADQTLALLTQQANAKFSK